MITELDVLPHNTYEVKGGLGLSNTCTSLVFDSQYCRTVSFDRISTVSDMVYPGHEEVRLHNLAVLTELKG